MGEVKEVRPMIGPHNEESNQKSSQEEEITFAWDETNVLL